jgi:hypothetical protein
MTQLSLIEPATGPQLRDKGIRKAVTKAEAINPSWSDLAYDFLRSYIQTHHRFLTEDIRTAAERAGIVSPASKRVWGSLILRAVREGIIRADGYAQVSNPQAHCANARIWVVR